MDNQPLVSIVIVNLNRFKELTHCIESLNSQNYKNYEIILIDNNSIDKSAEKIKSRFPNVHVYKTSKNLGTSYTRNAGVNFSGGKLIWFLDSDSYLLDRNVLVNLVKVFNTNDVDGIGGEAILDEKNQLLGTKKLILYPNGMTKGYLDRSNIIVKVEILATCNLMIKRKVIEDIGGFDHFYFFYLEDLDLTYRISKKGYKLYLIDKCPVIHYFSEKSRFKNHFKAKRNRIYFIVKNFNMIKILMLPIYDFFYIFNFDNLKRIKKKLFHNYNLKDQFIKESSKNSSIKSILYTLKITILTILSMIFSYVYIPYFLIKKFFAKKKAENFLKLVDKNDFTIED